jgi:hypothetical protein
MPAQKKIAAYLCLSLLFMAIFGCAAAHQRTPGKPAASALTVDSVKVANKPLSEPAAPAGVVPILRDSTGESIYPESDKSDFLDSVSFKQDPVDSNLIDDPSKEWK